MKAISRSWFILYGYKAERTCRPTSRRFENIRRAKEAFGGCWDVRLWDEPSIKTLIIETAPVVLDRFMALDKPAMKADIARAVILKRYGGIYLDTDFMVLHSLEPLCHLSTTPYLALRRVRFGSFVHSLLNESFSRKPESLQNYILISPPSHPVWSFLIEHIATFRKRRLLEHPALYYTRFTCLNALGRAVDRYLSITPQPIPVIYITQVTEFYGTHVGKGKWAGWLTTYGTARHEIVESLNWICATSICVNLLSAAIIFGLLVMMG